MPRDQTNNLRGPGAGKCSLLPAWEAEGSVDTGTAHLSCCISSHCWGRPVLSSGHQKTRLSSQLGHQLTVTVGKLFHNLGLRFLLRKRKGFNQMPSKLFSSPKTPCFHFACPEEVKLV